MFIETKNKIIEVYAESLEELYFKLVTGKYRIWLGEK